ncbi:hypothetical protein VNI00_015515 [Paramarasmius palmivorus]|uniref:C2H2-type domain-containing protein n=1 Tax=Paramarasmius palmivorus TaxID=297713 RepID=A0AAW0BJY5_9AGAR
MGTSKSSKSKSKSQPVPQVKRIHVEKVHRTPAFLKVEALSADGRRVRQRVVKVSGLSPTKKQRVAMTVPAFDSMLMDIDERVEDLVLGGQGLFVSAGVDAVDVEGSVGDIKVDKQGRNNSEGDMGKTMSDWRPMARQFLAEMMVLEGRPEEQREICWSCKASCDTPYRCRDCLDPHLRCKSCIVSHHKDRPFDRVERWNGKFFERTSLRDLGLVIQLGHEDGSACTLRDMARSGFVVVDVDSVQEVSIAYCACRSEGVVGQKWQQLMRRELYPGSVEDPYTAFTFRVLGLFHALTLKGKINLYDFYYGLEMRSNGGGCYDVKDRYDSFRRVTRQWRFLKMLKRGGIGNDPGRRLDDIGAGDLAVRCIACPQPGVNLPEGWENVPQEESFLYYKFLSVDACFRLKRRAISSEAGDPGLFTGLAYYVDQGPYQKWMRAAPDQKETNDCSSLAAVKQANTKFNRGYATTGCLLCMCSRHELCEPNGVVDLNRGEKFMLGDYAVGASQKLSSPLLKRVLSYDIACQYCKKFFDRMRLLPNEAAMEVSESKWSFVIPKLHIRGHERPCQETFALHLHPGAGQTDGEGIERLWAEVGPVGVSTREMGPGHRRDTIDDHQGARNWRKICGLGHLLRRREAEAQRQVVKQTQEYERFCQSQGSIRIEKWKRMVLEWESGFSEINPYSLSERGETEEDVRLRMAVQEAERSMRGERTLHEVAPSAFMLMGLEIEDQQRRMVLSMANTDGGTARQKTGDVEKRAKLGRLIARFRSVQQVYMPTALAYLATLPNYSNVDTVEKIPVLLPSGLPESVRSQSLMKEWLDREVEYRRAQLRTALRSLRTHLFVRVGLTIERTTQARGQKDSTRSRQELARNEVDIQAFKTKYQAAWNALMVLVGEEILQEQMPGYQVLHDHDVRSHEDEDSGCIVSSRKTRPANVPRPLITEGESRRTLSWIWTGVDVSGDSKAMQEALRIEWSKCWARKRRWDEELALVREEKRRVVKSLHFQAEDWLQKAMVNSDEPQEGCRAYALRQASLREGLVERFLTIWKTPIRRRTNGKPARRPEDGCAEGEESEQESESGDDGATALGLDDGEDDEEL